MISPQILLERAKNPNFYELTEDELQGAAFEHDRLVPLLEAAVQIIKVQAQALSKYTAKQHTVVLDDGKFKTLDSGLTPAGKAQAEVQRILESLN